MLSRTDSVDATAGKEECDLAEGAVLVVFVLFLLPGNFRVALGRRPAHHHLMLFTAGRPAGSANPMSLGALDSALDALIVSSAVAQRLPAAYSRCGSRACRARSQRRSA